MKSRGKPFKKGYIPWNKGIHHLSGLPKPWKVLYEENNAYWKGENVGYRGLHYWVIKHLGQPTICEYCGKDGLKGKQIHWANKSHKYLRKLTDWLRLCASCHKSFDSLSVVK